MAYKFKTYAANRGNYGSRRSTSSIKWIVIHYTGNDGDSDENNAKYFRNNIVKASAHYFVDSDSVTQAVPDDYAAYSVGGSKYSNCSDTGGGKYYMKCTNANSISIELCDDIKNGVVYPSAKTIANALELTRKLMKKYGIPACNVIRHFDVVGKSCPAYWCGTAATDKKWKTEFWNKLDAGEVVSKEKTPYRVKVTSEKLNVRNGAGTGYKINKVVMKDTVLTIVEEKGNWGRLKSGAGWISLKYTKMV